MGASLPHPSIRFTLLTLAFVFSSIAPASAHAFGIRYDLPLPLWLYLSGAGAAVALSFVIMAFFLRDRSGNLFNLRVNLLSWPPLGEAIVPLAAEILRIFSVAIFLFLLAAGIWGNPDPFKNFIPTFIWVVWWVGMAFLSSLVGNIWDLVNPWKVVGRWIAGLVKRQAQAHPYAGGLGKWPAVILFIVFAWMELISEQAEQPGTLAWIIIIYSVITWSGMIWFGRETWLKSGEIFTVAFSLLARFAPGYGENGRLWIRPPAVGLLCARPVHISMVCFVLLLLTSVTFDGLLETPSWAAILNWISENQALRPLLIAMQDAGIDLIAVIKAIALLVFPLLFIAVFFLTCMAIASAGGGDVPTLDIAGYFVLSIVPIAIAYHLSHYLSYLLIAGQNIIPLLSDPFGAGWNLFGTAGYAVDIGVVNAKMIWYISVCAIVIGHVAAVYIAHVMAIRVFGERRAALCSQIPMLVLMVGYTMISLWILSQPIIA